MNERLMRATRLGTLAAAVLVSLALRGRVETDFRLGVVASALWAVLGFWVVEHLVRLALVPRGRSRPGGTIALLVAAKVALYALALWALVTGAVPPLSCVLGFSLLLVVMVIAAIVTRPTLGFGPPGEKGMTTRMWLAAATLLLLTAGAALADDAPAHAQDVRAEDDHGAVEHAADAHATDAHGADEAGHDAAHGDAHGEHHDPYHLPNFIGIGFGVAAGWAWLDPIFAAIAAVTIMLLLMNVASRRTDDPGRLQAAVEMIMGGLDNLVQSVIGPEGRRYTPYLGTLFLFIWLNNLMGLVPFFHAATSAINTTAALAVCTFLYVQGLGIKENGPLGYLHHLAGSPRSGVEWAFVPLMFPLHVLGEFIKPLSLSLRLFGNVMGEDKLIAVFVVLGAGMLAFTHLPVGIPIQVPIVFLALLTSTIQALVFTLLSMVYIALMLPHEHHEEAHGH